MTKRKADIEKGLAARGIFPEWANEAEAAVLSGMSQDAFREKLPELETRGFPKPNPLNGRRPIRRIRAFWGLDDATQSMQGQLADVLEGGPEVEKWR